jgi:hypothetical protein
VFEWFRVKLILGRVKGDVCTLEHTLADCWEMLGSAQSASRHGTGRKNRSGVTGFSFSACNFSCRTTYTCDTH